MHTTISPSSSFGKFTSIEDSLIIYRLFGKGACEITFAPGNPDFLPKTKEIPAGFHAIDVEIPLSAPNGPALISW